MKVTMSRAEKVPGDNGEMTKAIVAFQSAKAGLLKALTLDMTAEAAAFADAALKKHLDDCLPCLERWESERTLTAGLRMMQIQASAAKSPAANRAGQYVKRPVGSHGPTINPGRTTNASEKRSRTTRSQSTFSSP